MMQNLIKITAVVISGVVLSGGNALALTLNPGGGDLTINGGHTCSKENSTSCSYSGLTNKTTPTTGQNCKTSQQFSLVDYCDNCGYSDIDHPNGQQVHTCHIITSCTSCNSGYTLTSQTYSPSVCGTLFLGVEYNTCCGACTNCTNGEWESTTSIGKQKRTVRTCDCGTCKDSGTEYRCAAGYYGGSSESGKCTRCPSFGNSEPGTPGKITAIDICYITGGSDATGSYVYESPCYYNALN